MGLFINKEVHPDVFKNNGEIAEPNQGYFKVDYFSELLKEQEKVNASLLQSHRNLHMLHHQQKNVQASKWEEVASELKALKEMNHQHEEFKNHAMEWLTMLDGNNIKLQRILENEGIVKQEIIDQINSVSQSNQAIVNQLEKYGTSNDQLAEQMNELVDLHKHMSDQISKQDNNQDEVISRLDNQEALMEKTLRQITHFRTILFERSNFIAEKIESSYNLTSSYIYKLLTGSDKPITMFMMNQKKEESQKSSD